MIQTTLHKFYILYYSIKICTKIMKRAFLHDLSKYSKHERAEFKKAKKLKEIQFYSDEYKQIMEMTLSSALTHHYKNNSHHPEYHKNGIDDMTFLDLLEMIIDWVSASKRTKNGDISCSISINKERFKYNDFYESLFHKIVKDVVS